MNWSITIIEEHIQNQVEENLKLEYKAADALQKTEGKKREIAKDISAMANAAGGVIIYGVKEFDEPSKKHLPERMDPVVRTEISKEWLEQVINSNIQPKIEGLIITPLPVDPDSTTVIYVVEIPQGNTAHQAADKKYYKRYNFELLPMEDYEIRDIMSRKKHPLVDLELELERRLREQKDISGSLPYETQLMGVQRKPKQWFEYELKIRIRNDGKVFANYVNYFLEIPEEILHEEEKHLEESKSRAGYKLFYGDNTIRDILDVKLNLIGKTQYSYGPSRYDPVLPGTRSGSKKLRLIDDMTNRKYELHWLIYADNAEVRSGSVKLVDLLTEVKDVWE